MASNMSICTPLFTGFGVDNASQCDCPELAATASRSNLFALDYLRFRSLRFVAFDIDTVIGFALRSSADTVAIRGSMRQNLYIKLLVSIILLRGCE